MKLVLQKHKTGCGVACLSMILNISYRQAMKKLHPKRFWWFSEATTTVGQLMDALDEFGYEYSILQEPTFHTSGKRAIVIAKSILNGEEANHAVVWNPENKNILDPIGPKYPLEHYLQNFVLAILIDNKPEIK